MDAILVTGGAGFIGSNFVKYMLSKYDCYRIINVDALTYAGNLENLREIENNPRYRFIKGDMTDKRLMERVFNKEEIKYVVNIAAESHVDRSIEGPEIFVKTNVLGTQILLDIAKENRIKKFLQISTDEVYGSLGETGYFTEKSEIKPNSPYSASKASADLLALAYYKTYQTPVSITRCSNNYGPYQFPEKLIPFMIAKAYAREPLPVYGDGLHVRDWLHVKDHCAAMDLVLHKGKDGEIYNVGGHNEKTNIELVKIILEKMNPEQSQIQFVTDRLGHDRRYAIDASKIKNELGWEPKIPFEAGIKETVEWYLSHVAWWK